MLNSVSTTIASRKGGDSTDTDTGRSPSAAADGDVFAKLKALLDDGILSVAEYDSKVALADLKAHARPTTPGQAEYESKTKPQPKYPAEEDEAAAPPTKKPSLLASRTSQGLAPLLDAAERETSTADASRQRTQLDPEASKLPAELQ
jgi:hypothetical protein